MNNISYIVQLLGACFIYICPAKKRIHFASRSIVSSSLLLVISYLVNDNYQVDYYSPVRYLYWTAYIVLCILFVWNLLDVSPFQALLCTACACGTQHIAFNLYGYPVLYLAPICCCSFLFFWQYTSAFSSFLPGNLPGNSTISSSIHAILPIITIIFIVLILGLIQDSPVAGAGGNQKLLAIYRIIELVVFMYFGR